MWQSVTATHIKSRARRTVEMNVFPKSEIMTYARIWFPPSEFSDHEIKPVEKEKKIDAGSDKRDV